MPDPIPPLDFTALLNSVEESSSYKFAKLLTSLKFFHPNIKDVLSPIQIQTLLNQAVVKNNPYVFKEILLLAKNPQKIEYNKLWSTLFAAHHTTDQVMLFLPFFNTCLNQEEFLQDVKTTLCSLQRNRFDLFQSTVNYLLPKVDIDYDSLSDLFAYNAKTVLFFKSIMVPLNARYTVSSILNFYTMEKINTIEDISNLDYKKDFKHLPDKEKIECLKIFIKSINSAQDKKFYVKKFSLLLDYFGPDFLSPSKDNLNNLFTILFSASSTSSSQALISFISSSYKAPSKLNQKCVLQLLNGDTPLFYKTEIIDILKTSWGIDSFSHLFKNSGFMKTMTPSMLTPPDLILDIYRCAPTHSRYSSMELTHHVLNNFINSHQTPNYLIVALKDILALPHHSQSKDLLSSVLSNFFTVSNLLVNNKRRSLNQYCDDYFDFISLALPHINRLDDVYNRLSSSAKPSFEPAPLVEKTLVFMKVFIEKQKLNAHTPISTSEKQLSSQIKPFKV